MSTANHTQLDLSAPQVIKTIQNRSLAVGGVGTIIALAIAFTRPTEFFRGYLVSYMDWLAICLGSMAIIMVRHMTGGGWGTIVRRILGASMRTWPLMAVLFVPFGLWGAQRLYPWMKPLDAIADPNIREHLEKHSFILHDYLNLHGFWIRAIIYFVLWGGMSALLSKWSKALDQPPVRDTSARSKMLSAPGLILYAFSISFAVIDWVMSLDPTWISTMYGLIFLAGQLIAALSLAVVVERILVNYRPMSILLRPAYVHDHGKFLLAFTMVWAYFSFSQWLIIWAGNLPEEISWYMRRIHGGWEYVALFLVIFHFFVPFFILLSRPFKRDIRQLAWLAVFLLFICWVDIFWHVEPAFAKSFTVTLADLVIPFAMGGWWLAYFCYNLNKWPLIPAYDATAQSVLEPEHE
jgi:hypothetical protein